MLDRAKRLILESLDPQITHFLYQENHNQHKYTFRDGSTLYIVYNRKGDYAYQLLFSSQPLDRVRFDSLDKKWDVDTKPHHFHPKGRSDAYRSPMTGNPDEDIPRLVSYILSGELRKANKRF